MKLSTQALAAICILLASLTGMHPPAGASIEVGPRSDWQWPTGGPAAVTRPFDPPALRWLPGHRGVDLQMNLGAPVYSPDAGTVIYAGPLVNRPVISIEHQSGLRLTFEPVDPAIRVGQLVAPGQVIGHLADGDLHDGLHWGAKYPGDHYIDPLVLLTGRVRLKPWD